MLLDQSTLHDLELVPAPGSHAATVWSLIDRTRSRHGREALRRRLLRPATCGEEIQGLQAAHRIVASDAAVYGAAIDRAYLDGVQSYLDAAWQLPCDMPPFATLRHWYRDYMRELSGGRSRVDALLSAASDLRQLLSASGSEVLHRIGDEIGRPVDALIRCGVDRLVRGTSVRAMRDFDQCVRGEWRGLFVSLLESIGRLEAIWSVGVASQEHGWIYPQVGGPLRIDGLVHPLLGPERVANDLVLDDGVRVCFVTGPNMAGKSTFLKAAGVAMVLAHLGAGVPATSMQFPVVGAIFSSVQIADSLSSGASFYLSEVRRIAALARSLAIAGSVFAVIDEPFRGTNVHDAAEATSAVMSRLAAHPAAMVLAASHLIDVADGIGTDRRFSLLHFSADVSEARPRFDYRIRDGVSTQRLGMTLLRQEGVLEMLAGADQAVTPAAMLEPGDSVQARVSVT